MTPYETDWEKPEFSRVPDLAENMEYLLPGIDPVTVRKTLQWAYHDFCSRSAALKTWRKMPIEMGCVAYPVCPLVMGGIDCVTAVWRGGVPLPAGAWRAVGTMPPTVMLRTPFADVVRDSADEPEFLWIEAVEVPDIGEENAPAPFLARYGQALVDGALARLMLPQGRAWSNPEEGRMRAADYERAVCEARTRATVGAGDAASQPASALDMSCLA